MPTYDYVCENCDHRFELFQSIKAKPIRKCPNCGKLTVNRLIGAGAGIIFKGSGFYETDYRSDSYKKAKEGETKTSSDKTDKKTETKAKDSKPADTAKPTKKDKKKSA
ncbi:MAG: zinc ribbon domain-containing protein [Sedimentisphaerales bacterium]|nr:zinc ribbon domain-containing protein [Sedimentisphaerales bacterium]